MKCIKCIKVAKGYNLDEIRRIDDIDADEKVKGGYWKFVPKSEWKVATRKPKVVEVVVEQSNEELSIEEKKLKRNKKK
jgi:DNA-binding transcriptional MerR regulator